MHYRLALDLGTSSIGLVAYQLDSQDEAIDIPYHAVRIFEEPLQPAKTGDAIGLPKKAARRSARLMRRQCRRKARRLKHLAYCLPWLGLEPKGIPPDSGQAIHRWRADAATQRVELAELALVLLKMSKRRGYFGGFRSDKAEEPEPTAAGKPPKTAKGNKMPNLTKDNRPNNDADEEKGVVKAGIERLKTAMAECGAKTLGQYLAYRHQNGIKIKLAPQDAEEKLYAHRDLLEAEFEQIWATQARHHPILNETRNVNGQAKPVKQIFHEVLFRQRPLKSTAGMVGRCPLEPDLARAPMAQPAAQAFRIEKQLADLRWGMGNRAKPLYPAQKAVIRALLAQQKTVSFKAIYEALEQAGCPREPGRGLNMDRVSREELTGDKTRAAWRSPALNLLGEWDALDRITQVQVINFLADLGSPEQLCRDDWPTQFVKSVRDGKNAKNEWRYRNEPRTFSAPFIGFIDRLRQCRGYGRLSEMGFESGRSAYSVKALEKLTQPMRQSTADEPIDERQAIELAYPAYYAEKPPLAKLPPPPLTGNTVVDVALHQVELEIRKAIQQLGGLPSEIIIELARAMAQGVSKRNQIELENKKNQNARKKAQAELKKHGLSDSRTHVLRYLLWQEQEQHCPYCTEGLLSLHEVVDGNATDIDHILPRSLTQVGRKRDQLVLVHAACNRDKGDDTPWEAWGGDPPKNPLRWGAVLAQAGRFRDKKHRGKLLGKAKLLELQEWSDDTSVQGFSDRQFQETAWIAKHTAQWLRSLCEAGKVQVSRGQMTAHFRRIWHLETVIPEVRFEENLPVLDTEKERVTWEDFGHHRGFWEGRESSETVNRTDRRIDKRIDHRHHLIDALVIGLCTPKLYQRLASEYKHKAERKKQGETIKLRLSIDPLFHHLRTKALELVRHCNLTHKPDRYPDGALFKATAYGMAEVAADGTVRCRFKPEELEGLTAANQPQGSQRRLTCRKRLDELVDAKKDTAEIVRQKINDIVSVETRKTVLEAFDRQIADGKTPLQALSEPILHPQFATPIRQVKVYFGNKPGEYLDADAAHTVTHTSRQGLHYKLLQHEGNACLEVWQEGKTVKTRLLKPVEALAEKQKRIKPGKGVRRFYKNDTVHNTEDNKRYLVRQIWTANNGTLVLTLITEAREVRNMNAAEGLKKVSGKSLLRWRRV